MFNLFHRYFFFTFLRIFRIILTFQSFLPAFQLVIVKAPQNCSISLVTSKVSRNTGNVQCARHQTLSHSVTRTPNYWTMNISYVFKADGIFKQRTRAFFNRFVPKEAIDWLNNIAAQEIVNQLPNLAQLLDTTQSSRKFQDTRVTPN